MVVEFRILQASNHSSTTMTAMTVLLLLLQLQSQSQSQFLFEPKEISQTYPFALAYVHTNTVLGAYDSPGSCG